jgi:hypothetical protein
MFCRNCGAQNDDRATQCSRCGAALSSAAATGMPAQDIPNYLVWAILATVFCCLPFGIVGIVYAAQVNSKLAGGDVNGALAASKNAKTWTLVSFFCGLAVIGFYFVMMILGLLAGGAKVNVN